jgi:hypothetical protein
LKFWRQGILASSGTRGLFPISTATLYFHLSFGHLQFSELRGNIPGVKVTVSVRKGTLARVGIASFLIGFAFYFKEMKKGKPPSQKPLSLLPYADETNTWRRRHSPNFLSLHSSHIANLSCTRLYLSMSKYTLSLAEPSPFLPSYPIHPSISLQPKSKQKTSNNTRDPSSSLRLANRRLPKPLAQIKHKMPHPIHRMKRKRES